MFDTAILGYKVTLAFSFTSASQALPNQDLTYMMIHDVPSMEPCGTHAKKAYFLGLGLSSVSYQSYRP